MALQIGLAGIEEFKGLLQRQPFALCTPVEEKPANVTAVIPWADYGAVDSTSEGKLLINLAGQGGVTLAQGAPFTKIRSIYIDNTASSATVYVKFPDTGHTVYALPNTAGWFPVMTNVLQAYVYAVGFEAGNIPVTQIHFTNINREGFFVPAATVITPFAGTRGFDISPAVEGKTTWDLDTDGPLTLDGPGVWTITPLPLFEGTVELYGPGGSSGAIAGGTGRAVDDPTPSQNTTFAGLIAGAGMFSVSNADHTTIKPGGTGGVASGGTTNLNGDDGQTPPNYDFGGDGGENNGPAGGGTQNGGADPTAGIAGNAPGGGASGCAFTGFPLAMATGGGGGGAYTAITYAVGILTAGNPYSLVVGGPGTAGQTTGGTVTYQGAQGAPGRAIIT